MPQTRPLIAITNDDSTSAKGLHVLIEEMRKIGDVVVVTSIHKMSGKGHSITAEAPLRLECRINTPEYRFYESNGTPVDCYKLMQNLVLKGKKPDLLVSGVNHGSNASVNVLYSGTMGATIEACICGVNAIGFSLNDHRPDADFEHIRPYLQIFAKDVLKNGLPENVCLNINFPKVSHSIKGVEVCAQAKARWAEAFNERRDPHGLPYYWLQGKFLYDATEKNDYNLLHSGYITIVPTHFDLTHYESINTLKNRFSNV